MSDHTVIAILVGVLALLAGGLGYGLGEQRRHRDETTQYAHHLEGQIEEHERRLRAHGALIEVIAEDYDPPSETAPRKERRKLPEGWAVYKGGGALLLLAALGSWIRRHWRKIAVATVAASAGAAVTLGLLAHGAPPGRRPFAGRPPSPPASASAARPLPTTKPGHTPRRTLAPTPVPPVRRRQPSPIPSPARSSPPTPPPRPAPGPVRSSAKPSPTPKPTPKTACPVGVAVQLGAIGVTICI